LVERLHGMQEVSGSTPLFSTKHIPAIAGFFMEFHVYIIYSQKLDRYYLGYTENIVVRLQQHNSGESTFTSKATDWQLCYTEKFSSRELAHKRELEIKRKKSRKYIEWLIQSYTSITND
jgi:putative endonuclease